MGTETFDLVEAARRAWDEREREREEEQRRRAQEQLSAERARRSERLELTTRLLHVLGVPTGDISDRVEWGRGSGSIGPIPTVTYGDVAFQPVLNWEAELTGLRAFILCPTCDLFKAQGEVGELADLHDLLQSRCPRCDFPAEEGNP